MELCPIRYDEAAYGDYVHLFSTCFPNATKYSRDYLDWLYRRNPDGPVIGFDAIDGGRLAAHYACIPTRVQIGNADVKALLSLNTATHPDFQGKGLFTKLAERTYAFAAEQEFDCVYGVANANSTPGFVRKLNFQLVKQLDAKVGMGAPGIDFEVLDSLQFRRLWGREAFDWRCASPVNPILVRAGQDKTTCLAPALFGRKCMAIAEFGEERLLDRMSTQQGSPPLSPMRLFIGLIPPHALKHGLYVDIPKIMRPSPLNLIYRSLSGRIPAIDPALVFINFLDFDAY